MIKNCKVCGKEFDAHRTARYCSPECKSEWTTARRRVMRRARYAANPERFRAYARKKYQAQREPLIRICGICGEEFDARGSQKYCSDKCARKAQSRSQMKYYRAHSFELNEKRRLKYRQKCIEYWKAREKHD